jgi:hypothetical protein
MLNELKYSCFEFALKFFSKNLDAVREEQGEHFHHGIKEMERRYQGRWNVNMMGGCCYRLCCKVLATSHTRNSNICSSADKRKRQYKATE